MSDTTLTAKIETRTVKKGKQAFIQYKSSKGVTQTVALNERILSAPLVPVLKKSPEELVGLVVEFLLEAGQVKHVTEAGKIWEPSASAHAPHSKKYTSNTGGKSYSYQQSVAKGVQRKPVEDFENPYNFIPALPRKTDHPELGDATPVGHQQWSPKHWSGCIVVQIKTCTPLLIPDLSNDENDHKRFGVRVDGKGTPYLPPTTVKGSLRACYEAITNSRMGVFTDHKKPLAYRTEMKAAKKVVPAMINDAGNVVLQPGQSKIAHDGSPAGQQLYAAWLPIHLIKKQRFAIKHGMKIRAKVVCKEHRTRRFTFLQAIELVPYVTEGLRNEENKSSVSAQSHARVGDSHALRNPMNDKSEKSFWINGRVCISGKNMQNKHDERIFFVDDNHAQHDVLEISISDNLRHRWQTLITNYQEEHRKDINRGIKGPDQIRDGVFSRHITNGEAETRLETGTLCYASIEQNSDGGFDVRALYPVQISRDLYDKAPAELVHDTLVSARHLGELSPADRVFGCVCTDGKQSYKGQLRIGAVYCGAGSDAIEKVGIDDQGVPLAILGQPKPAQAEFYASEDPHAEPLQPGMGKSAAYAADGGLRGRKFYPHQRQATQIDDYWDPNHLVSDSMTFNRRAVYREWLSHDKSQGSQNSSVTAWVKPGTCFEVPIDVTNLSAVELGALLWMLQLDAQNYLRMGGGKPLGFGSVQLSVMSLDLRDGVALKTDYRSFGRRGAEGGRITNTNQTTELIKAYKDALPDAVNEQEKSFEQLRVIQAFLNATLGGSLPIHYPRTDKQPFPQGENFKWFVNNQKAKEPCSLPALWGKSRGLPSH